MIQNVELRQGPVLAMLFVDSIVIILNLKINYSQTISLMFNLHITDLNIFIE